MAVGTPARREAPTAATIVFLLMVILCSSPFDLEPVERRAAPATVGVARTVAVVGLHVGVAVLAGVVATIAPGEDHVVASFRRSRTDLAGLVPPLLALLVALVVAGGPAATAATPAGAEVGERHGRG